MRIETVIKCLRDLGCNARMPNLDELQAKPAPPTGAYWKPNVLVPLTAANQPLALPELCAELATITRHVDDYTNRAHLSRAA
jgi:hypothetical protein